MRPTPQDSNLWTSGSRINEISMAKLKGISKTLAKINTANIRITEARVKDICLNEKYIIKWLQFLQITDATVAAV